MDKASKLCGIVFQAPQNWVWPLIKFSHSPFIPWKQPCLLNCSSQQRSGPRKASVFLCIPCNYTVVMTYFHHSNSKIWFRKTCTNIGGPLPPWLEVANLIWLNQIAPWMTNHTNFFCFHSASSALMPAVPVAASDSLSCVEEPSVAPTAPSNRITFVCNKNICQFAMLRFRILRMLRNGKPNVDP